MPPRPVVVIKIGSNALVGPDDRLDLAFLDAIAGQVAGLVADGLRPVLVSSGAVASGMARIGLDQRPEVLGERQALAAIGQADLVHRWQVAFAGHRLQGAQLLLTAEDFDHRERYLNLAATFRSCFSWNVVPVVNENDTVSVTELALGDNDRLSALVASQLGARHLVLLTDIAGYFDADPRTQPDARLVPRLERVTPAVLAAAGGSGRRGTGGMRSKLAAAALAAEAGVETVIADARAPGVLAEAVSGAQVGTRIPGRSDGRPSARRRWLALARGGRGRVVVDDGAVAALRSDGSSLLPAGIVGVEGDFARGDTVAITAADGSEVGRGLAGLSARELRLVAGERMAAARQRLGYPLPRAAVHRDDLLLYDHCENT